MNPSKYLIFSVDHECIGVIQQSMLEEHNGKASFLNSGLVFRLDSEQLQDVSINCSDIEILRGIPVVLVVFHSGKPSVTMVQGDKSIIFNGRSATECQQGN